MKTNNENKMKINITNISRGAANPTQNKTKRSNSNTHFYYYINKLELTQQT